MAITSTCPGCGATLLLDDQPGEITCQYCGTRFEIKMDDVNPTFRKTEPSAESPAPAPQIIDGTFNPPASDASAADANLYNPPIAGQAPVAPNDLYNPPIPNAPSGYPSQPYTPPPFNPTPLRSQGMLTGSRWLIALAIAAGVIFCVSCLCMVALVRGVH
jgi:hypothetical protein